MSVFNKPSHLERDGFALYWIMRRFNAYISCLGELLIKDVDRYSDKKMQQQTLINN